MTAEYIYEDDSGGAELSSLAYTLNLPLAVNFYNSS